MKIGLLLAVALVSCGFDDYEFEYRLSAYSGEPVPAAMARLGRPVQTAYNQGRRVYYWRAAYSVGRGYLCTIWGSAQHNVITNWGYRDCAF
jgi:hypothetical protein